MLYFNDSNMPRLIYLKISGGTGITPFYQLFHTTLSHGAMHSHQTRFTLLHFSRTPADLPPSMILQPLVACTKQHPQRFRLHLFVDSLDGSHSHEYLPNVGRITKEIIEQFGLGQSRP